jgi:hypothetical protein
MHPAQQLLPNHVVIVTGALPNMSTVAIEPYTPRTSLYDPEPPDRVFYFGGGVAMHTDPNEAFEQGMAEPSRAEVALSA